MANLTLQELAEQSSAIEAEFDGDLATRLVVRQRRNVALILLGLVVIGGGAGFGYLAFLVQQLGGPVWFLACISLSLLVTGLYLITRCSRVRTTWFDRHSQRLTQTVRGLFGITEVCYERRELGRVELHRHVMTNNESRGGTTTVTHYIDIALTDGGSLPICTFSEAQRRHRVLVVRTISHLLDLHVANV